MVLATIFLALFTLSLFVVVFNRVVFKGKDRAPRYLIAEKCKCIEVHDCMCVK